MVAAAGNGKKEFDGKPISKQLERLIEDREHLLASSQDNSFIKITLDDPGIHSSEVISTILCEGDAIGAVILYGRDEKRRFGETEQKLAMTAAAFLGRQMEQ